MRRELAFRAVGRPKLPEDRDHTSSDFRRHRRAAGHGLAQRFEEARGLGLLEQIAGSPGAQRVENAIVVVVDREDQDDEVRVPLLQNADAVDAAHAGQPDVVEHDIGQVLSDPIQRLFHRSERAGAAESRCPVDDRRESLADLTTVFDNGDANRRLAGGGHRHGPTVKSSSDQQPITARIWVAFAIRASPSAAAMSFP